MMSRRLGLAAAISALLLSASAQAGETEADLKAQAANIVKDYAGSLQSALKGAMEQSGPVAAIGVCHERGPAIAAELSAKTGWKVARTSLKPRNPGSAPTAHETAVMTEFEARLAAGEKAEALIHATAEQEDGRLVFHVVKAIPTAELCLTCHGAALDPAVKNRLTELYPTDTATGFKIGQMRGVFTLSKAM